MPEEEFEDVLLFWFPRQTVNDHAAMVRQFEWWFRGGADSAIVGRFAGLLERAARGELDHWSDAPRSRLALIVLLDQFSRSVYRGTARAFAQDPKALALALEGIEIGHYAALETPWEKTFFFLPLGHSEELAHLEKAVELAEALVGRRRQSCAGCSSTPRHRRAPIATSSPASADILIATPSWGGHRPRTNLSTWPAANWCTRAHSRANVSLAQNQPDRGRSLPPAPASSYYGMMRTMPPSQLYEADFYAWTRQQAKELRRLAKTRPNLPLDLEHIAEEIRDLGKSEHDAAFSLAQRVIEHLLLIEHSPAADERLHWADEVDGFRDQLKRKLSPTIRRHLRRDLGQVFADGRRLVERKMRRYGEERAAGALPESCPYTLEQVLGDWFPEVELRSE